MIDKVLEAEAPRRSIGARRNPETQAAVLDAAEAILKEEGPSGFSIEAVARRAKAGKPTIYRWWPNKTALLLDVYHRQKMAMPHAETGNLEDDLVEMLAHLFAMWGDTGAGLIFRSVIAEAQVDAEAAKALATYVEDRRGYTGEMFGRARARGEVSADADLDRAAEALTAVAWFRLLTGRLDAGRDELRAVARQIIEGLKPR